MPCPNKNGRDRTRGRKPICPDSRRLPGNGTIMPGRGWSAIYLRVCYCKTIR